MPPPEALRPLRALEVLEHAGTPDARQLLETLAKGADGARLTREAHAAVQPPHPSTLAAKVALFPTAINNQESGPSGVLFARTPHWALPASLADRLYPRCIGKKMA